MAYEPEAWVDDTTPAINDTNLNKKETHLKEIANNMDYNDGISPLIGVGAGGGSSVILESGTWNEARDGTAILDGNLSPVLSGGIATGLNNLTAGETYYSHDETGLDTASYDTNSYSQATLVANQLVIHNSKIYNLTFPNIYQHSYVKGNINGCSYDSKSFDVSSEMTSPEGMFAVASKVFVGNHVLDTPNFGRIYQYTWTPDEIDTMNYDTKYYDVYASVGMHTIREIQNIGNRVYVYGFGSKGTVLEQFYMSDLTDITTLSHEYTFVFDMTGTGFTVGRTMKISGGKLYLNAYDGADYEDILQYNFPDPLDVRKITADDKVLDTAAQEDDIYGVEVDDEYIYIIGNTGGGNDIIYQYSMTEVAAIGNISTTVSPREAGVALSTTELKVTLKESKYIAIKELTGTTHTLDLTDDRYTLHMNNGAATTVTVPPNVDVAFEVNTYIDVVPMGAGTVTFAQGAGVTINGDLNITDQYKTATLKKMDTNIWSLTGSVN